MELSDKEVKNIIGKLERYSFTLDQVLKSNKGNFVTRTAVKKEYTQTLELIDLLKEK